MTTENITIPVMSSDPITLFVAMPYSDLGEHAKWRKPQNVEDFYKQVGQTVGRRMNRTVELRIEKYSPQSGLVIDAMFRAIHTADVFIADLTGSNANVFLELGIRYGVSNKVTILTTQEDRPVPFDLNQMRLVRYANGPTQEAEDAIARIVFEELESLKGGSPVLSRLDVKVVPRGEWERLAGIRVDLLIAESKRATDPQVRLNHVLEAVQTDPLSRTARIELARVFRARREFDAALSATEDALKVFPKSADLHKERGLILDRMTAQGDNRLDEALAAYSAALRLDDRDADLYGCYGGALRRKGLLSDDATRARYLDEALKHYRKSMELERHSTYAGLNVLRLLMLTNDRGDSVRKEMKRMFHLSSFEVTDSEIRDSGDQFWRMFDLADVFALMNERDQALDTYKKAIEIIPEPVRRDTLVSPIRSWRELLTAGSLEKQVCTNAEDILNLLESHAGPAER